MQEVLCLLTAFGSDGIEAKGRVLWLRMGLEPSGITVGMSRVVVQRSGKIGVHLFSRLSWVWTDGPLVVMKLYLAEEMSARCVDVRIHADIPFTCTKGLVTS
jgi:hypothetical protein